MILPLGTGTEDPKYFYATSLDELKAAAEKSVSPVW